MAKKMKYKVCKGCASYKGICNECINGNCYNDMPKKFKKPVAIISNYSKLNLFKNDIEDDFDFRDYAFTFDIN